MKKKQPRLPRYKTERRRILLNFEFDYVWTVLELAGGNIARAASIADIDRKHLWRIMRRTGIHVEPIE